MHIFRSARTHVAKNPRVEKLEGAPLPEGISPLGNPSPLRGRTTPNSRVLSPELGARLSRLRLARTSELHVCQLYDTAMKKGESE